MIAEFLCFSEPNRMESTEITVGPPPIWLEREEKFPFVPQLSSNLLGYSISQ